MNVVFVIRLNLLVRFNLLRVIIRKPLLMLDLLFVNSVVNGFGLMLMRIVLVILFDLLIESGCCGADTFGASSCRVCLNRGSRGIEADVPGRCLGTSGGYN